MATTAVPKVKHAKEKPNLIVNFNCFFNLLCSLLAFRVHKITSNFVMLVTLKSVCRSQLGLGFFLSPY